MTDLDEQLKNLEEGYHQVKDNLPQELTSIQTMLGEAVTRVHEMALSQPGKPVDGLIPYL